MARVRFGTSVLMTECVLICNENSDRLTRGWFLEYVVTTKLSAKQLQLNIA